VVGHKGGGAELDHRVGGGGVGLQWGDGQGGNSGEFWWGRTDRVDQVCRRRLPKNFSIWWRRVRVVLKGTSSF